MSLWDPQKAILGLCQANQTIDEFASWEQECFVFLTGGLIYILEKSDNTHRRLQMATSSYHFSHFSQRVLRAKGACTISSYELV